MCWFYFLGVHFLLFCNSPPVWPHLYCDNSGTMKEQMPVISCHYSTLVSHKHIPVSSHGRLRVQCYLLPVMRMSVCVRHRLINRKIRKRKWDKWDDNGTQWEWMTEKETYPTTALTFPLCPLGHKFGLDDTVGSVRQTGSSQDRSRRLKQDLLWCWLCSVVTGVEQHGELDCCYAQFPSFFSLAAETTTLPWFGHRTSTCLTRMFLIRARN